MLRLKKVLVVVTMLAALLAVAGCGSSAKSSSSSSSTTAASSAAGSGTSSQTSTVAAGSCGTIPTQMPADPSGALAKLPKSIQSAYNLLGTTVYPSAWTNWKPTHSGPYKIYFSPGNISTPFIQGMLGEFNKLKGSSKVITTVTTQDSGNSVQTQIQQIQQAIRQKYDLMVILPLSPAADTPVMEAAGKAGIPVLAPLNSASSKYVVGIDPNVTLTGAYLMQALASILDSKGSILEMQGIPGVQSSDLSLKGAGYVLKSCPNMSIAGSPVGQFVPSVAKAQTLEFLTAHPQTINGVFQVAGMAAGIMQAFIQTGRAVPPVADEAATPGALAYWSEHKSTYKGVASASPPIALADATWQIGLGLLGGRGIKISDIAQKPLLITNANLSQWVEPGWTIDTPGAYAPGPPNVYYPTSYLQQFFTKPAK
ncbi:MAG: substrate-binding domain-containing protein [Solirubrobacteraceae bacterium]